MITVEQIQQLKTLVTSKQTGSGDKGKIVAKLDIKIFCDTIHEVVPEYTGDVVDVLAKVQRFINKNSDNQRVVLGYNNIEKKVHWHVVEEGHWLYASSENEMPHICPPKYI